jgi:hypothetical protein
MVPPFLIASLLGGFSIGCVPEVADVQIGDIQSFVCHVESACDSMVYFREGPIRIAAIDRNNGVTLQHFIVSDKAVNGGDPLVIGLNLASIARPETVRRIGNIISADLTGSQATRLERSGIFRGTSIIPICFGPFLQPESRIDGGRLFTHVGVSDRSLQGLPG